MPHRHYRKPESNRIGADTYCGLPIVADEACVERGRTGPGIWEPAYFATWAPSDILELPLCDECKHANAATKPAFKSCSFDPR